MITHFKYWNKWRKKFPNAYSKWTKFLVLIGLKKPYTFQMLKFVDRYNAAVVSFNKLTEVFNQVVPKDKEGAISDEVSEV